MVIKERSAMPPKARITKEMVVNAAFEVTRAEGGESVNARTVAKKLGCSTQPVMYHFATIEDLKKAVYEKVGCFHTEYLMNIPPQEDSMLGIGLNYIRFAVEEPNLFRFLFQSGIAGQNSLLEMIDSQEMEPVISSIQEAMELDRERTKEIFITLAMFVHGYASILIGNKLEFEECVVKTHLERVYRGARFAIEEETK